MSFTGTLPGSSAIQTEADGADIRRSAIRASRIVQNVLEETGYAYRLDCENGGTGGDYAEFASRHALTSFRSALNDPDMSYEELCALLRGASNRSGHRRCKTPWSIFMANYIARSSGGVDTAH